MNATKVELKCISKKESIHHDQKSINTHIELEVPYSSDSVYFKLSGGTNMALNTINKDAADMFVVGNKYEVVISPVTEETK